MFKGKITSETVKDFKELYGRESCIMCMRCVCVCVCVCLCVCVCINMCVCVCGCVEC
jgi:hypothetical protein